MSIAIVEKAQYATTKARINVLYPMAEYVDLFP